MTRAADVQAHRGVEFQGIATRGGFWAAEHHANFHANLVDEHHQGIGAFDVAREFAQGLAHQARLQAHVAVAHFAFDFGFWHQSRHRVNHHHVHATRAHEHVTDFQCLLACVGLRHQQVFDFYAQFARINRVEGIFCIDESAHTACFLALGHGFQTHGGFTRRFWAINFHYATAWQAAHAQSQIQTQ